MENLSWFGYPNDAVPSIRNLLLGLQPQVGMQVLSM